MAKILDGELLSEQILRNLKKKIKRLSLDLKLGIILVGEDGPGRAFVNQKQRACRELGINLELFKFSPRIKTQVLKKEIEKIGRRKDISGLVVQLPLPQKINTEEVLELISPKKDPDCLSPANLGKFYNGHAKILPPAVETLNKLLKRYKIDLREKRVVIMGGGRLTGKPISVWLINRGITVSILNQSTKNKPFFTKSADLIISGAGKPGLIKGKMLKRGVAIIDFGTSLEKGKLRGDVDFESCSKKASGITPVPGGTGPLTVACLMENLVKLKIWLKK